MKKLIRKFKEMYKTYDYNEQDIDILLDLLDIVLDMMNIIEIEDHGYAKKLSSFIQILSSGYSNTLMDAILIEEIYTTNIIPILEELDKKYTQKFVAINSKEIINGIPHTVVSTDKAVLKLSEDFVEERVEFDDYRKSLQEEMKRDKSLLNDRYIVPTKDIEKLIPDDYDREEIDTLIEYIENNKDTDDPVVHQVIFNMSKDIVSILYNIYDSFTCGKSQEHKEQYLEDLVSIRNIMETISISDNMSIQLLSDTIRSLCYSLAQELNVNDIMPPSSIALIELKFKSMEGIKFEDTCFVNN